MIRKQGLSSENRRKRRINEILRNMDSNDNKVNRLDNSPSTEEGKADRAIEETMVIDDIGEPDDIRVIETIPRDISEENSSLGKK